jgi:hypothetical protein
VAAAPRTAPRFPTVPPGAGHYESFYLKANDPRGGRAVWLRYTVHKRPGAAAVGSLWCTLFDAAAAAPLAAKATLPPEALGTGPDHYLHVGASRFAPGMVAGAVPGGPPARPDGAGAAWDLRFEPGGPALDHLGHAWMYRTPLPRTKPRTLYPAARFTGTVTAGGRSVELDGWPGMVGHNWGSEHAARWIWLHAAFPELAGAWLDVVAARVALGRGLSPWVAYGAVELDGARLPLGGLGRARATAIREAPGGCELTVPGAGLVLRATVTVPAAHMVAWEYADPGGGVHHALNCSIADVGVVVERPGTATVELAGSRTAAYELGVRERDHGVPLQPFADG